MWRQQLAKWAHLSGFYLIVPAIVLVSWGELNPSASALELEVWDKSLHFMAYFGLAGLICLALNGSRRVFAATMALMLFGGVLEVLQGFTGRDPSFADEIANMIGSALGAATGWFILWLLRANFLAGPDAS